MPSACFVIARIILCIFKLSVIDLRNELLQWSNQIRDSACWILMTHWCNVWEHFGHASAQDEVLTCSDEDKAPNVWVTLHYLCKNRQWVMLVCNIAPTFVFMWPETVDDRCSYLWSHITELLLGSFPRLAWSRKTIKLWLNKEQGSS